MRIYTANIAQGIGDNILVKCCADAVKHQYDKFYFTHDTHTVNKEKNGGQKYWNFLFEIGKLFFSEHPYIYNQGNHPFKPTNQLLADFNIQLEKPKLSVYQPLLCKGNSLNLGEEYIVITTKIREIEKGHFYKLSTQLWQTINILSQKYKIVILGEREIEMSSNYLLIGRNQVYSIYEQIISNIPSNRLIDLTIPILGITSPELIKLQQDCLIMKEAKFVITLGNGGNWCMAMAIANIIGYRQKNSIWPDIAGDMIFSKTYDDAFVTKDWDKFIEKLREYL